MPKIFKKLYNISKSIVFLGKKMLARGGMQCDSRLKIVLEIEISETSKKKGPRCPYKKKLLKVKFLNSFTLLYYYIKIIKYNKHYDLLLLFY